MARCEVCRKEMRRPTTTTCSREKRRAWPDDLRKCRTPAGSFAVDGPRERCSDCNVLKGGIHHWGCDQEKCPVCGGQFISCGCFDEAFDHLAEPGE